MIDERTHETLSSLSQSSKLRSGEVVAYLSRLAVEHDLLEPDWKDKIAEDRVSEQKRKLDYQQDRKVELEKMKTRLKVKHSLLMKYVDTLEPNERKNFIESMMIDIKSADFIDRLGEMEIVAINGKRRLVRMSEGKPLIGIDPEKILVCDRGYHVLNAFCQCGMWRSCKLRRDEYVDYKVRESMR